MVLAVFSLHAISLQSKSVIFTKQFENGTTVTYRKWYWEKKNYHIQISLSSSPSFFDFLLVHDILYSRISYCIGWNRLAISFSLFTIARPNKLILYCTPH